ncbi:hypothetical protein HYH03_003340 [Edaphochlamys debaryana]|uniref:Uncharacterized protein n=1 Tax=Edaphochlamys debaryana TaxID=47281 RepID=A0A835YJ31_9CHLO|nr:hypothetical protein HYH03_003340 [Edaphochlamys debaryana]|eukprot:KAG2498589.1 hypothetical protein HYH03_003340 [Edaphochlamys debaryana]
MRTTRSSMVALVLLGVAACASHQAYAADGDALDDSHGRALLATDGWSYKVAARMKGKGTGLGCLLLKSDSALARRVRTAIAADIAAGLGLDSKSVTATATCKGPHLTSIVTLTGASNTQKARAFSRTRTFLSDLADEYVLSKIKTQVVDPLPGAAVPPSPVGPMYGGGAQPPPVYGTYA